MRPVSVTIFTFIFSRKKHEHICSGLVESLLRYYLREQSWNCYCDMHYSGSDLIGTVATQSLEFVIRLTCAKLTY